MLEINNFSKFYGDKKVVDNLSISVQSGDIYGFIGANGAGKTTTIKAVVGIHDFENGSITIDGHSIKEEPVICKKMMAYIPDNPDLYEHMTGFQYINFIADLFEIPTEIRRERILKYSDLFEMTKHLSGMISSYSHGMKQRTAIISALVHSPKLLILDEPFVGIDSVSEEIIMNTLRKLKEKGHTILIVHHDLRKVHMYFDNVLLINKELIAYGETKETFTRENLTKAYGTDLFFLGGGTND